MRFRGCRDSLSVGDRQRQLVKPPGLGRLRLGSRNPLCLRQMRIQFALASLPVAADQSTTLVGRITANKKAVIADGLARKLT